RSSLVVATAHSRRCSRCGAGLRLRLVAGHHRSGPALLLGGRLRVRVLPRRPRSLIGRGHLRLPPSHHRRPSLRVGAGVSIALLLLVGLTAWHSQSHTVTTRTTTIQPSPSAPSALPGQGTRAGSVAVIS